MDITTIRWRQGIALDGQALPLGHCALFLWHDGALALPGMRMPCQGHKLQAERLGATPGQPSRATATCRGLPRRGASVESTAVVPCLLASCAPLLLLHVPQEDTAERWSARVGRVAAWHVLGWVALLPDATPLGAVRHRPADGINDLVRDEEVGVGPLWPKGIIARQPQLPAALPPPVCGAD